MIQKIDSRNRIYLPAQFRRICGSNEVYVTISDNSLIVTPITKAFIENELKNLLEMPYGEVLKLQGKEPDLSLLKIKE